MKLMSNKRVLWFRVGFSVAERNLVLSSFDLQRQPNPHNPFFLISMEMVISLPTVALFSFFIA
jgi:hypothetical protein